MAEETKKAFKDFLEMSGMDDFRGVYEDIKPYVPALLPLWEVIREKGLGVKDALVAIEYASNRTKAETELQVMTNELEDMQIQATILDWEIMALKIKKLELLGDEPPSSQKAAQNESAAIGNGPRTTSQLQTESSSGDHRTTNKTAGISSDEAPEL